MDNYVECTCCGKLIKYGTNVVVDKEHIGIFCSMDCWATIHGEPYTFTLPLDDTVVSDYNE